MQQDTTVQRFIKSLEETQKTFSEFATRDEVAQLVNSILDNVRAINNLFAEKVTKNNDIIAERVKSIRADLVTIETTLKARIGEESAGIRNEIRTTVDNLLVDHRSRTHTEIQGVVDKLQTQLEQVRSLIPTLPDYEGRFAELEAKIPVLPPEKIGEDYRNALEALPEGEKLAIDAIENLENELKELRKIKTTPSVTTGGNALQTNLLIETANLTNWIYLVSTWSTEPTLSASITGGDVYTYTLDGTTRYRFVPTAYDPAQDAFYTTFTAGTLSGLIVARG